MNGSRPAPAALLRARPRHPHPHRVEGGSSRAAPSRRLVALALATATLLLGACAPRAGDEGPSAEAASRVAGPVAYMPTATGARWSYLPNGAQLSEPLIVTTVEGPTVQDGVVRTAWRTAGRGLDVRYFREHRPDGTFLFREERPGTRITFDPPIRELPGEPLRVGHTWSGTTTATVTFPEAERDSQVETLEIEWVHTVVDRRTVEVAAGEFEVFVLNFTSRTIGEDELLAEELTQEIWYSPYLGEVRTENGFFLVESNLIGLPTEADR